MGGFILVRKDRPTPLEQVRRGLAPALQAMTDKGLTLAETIEREGFVSFVFGKRRLAEENVRHFADQDFIFSTGTMLYRGLMGGAALESLYRDFSEEGDYQDHLQGKYAVVLFKQGRLHVFNDYAEYYHIFTDRDESVLSSSFLAVRKATGAATVSEQELLEYLIFGIFFGERTLFREINFLPENSIHRLLPSRGSRPKEVRIPVPGRTASTEEKLDFAEDYLGRYFGLLKSHFGEEGEICLGLTGGADSRLVLALLRRVGLRPSLYVYGDRGSPDVVLAKALAAKVGSAIDHVDKAALNPPPNSPLEVVRDRYHLLDGLSIDGVFDNGADLFTRLKRTRRARLQLNGASGELLRDKCKLLGSGISLKGFAASGMAGNTLVHPAFFTGAFNPEEFAGNLAAKFRSLLGVSGDRIDRDQAEWAHVLSTMKIWSGRTLSSNNLLTYCLTPYAEPGIILLSSVLSPGERRLGRFQTRLLNRIDPELAGVGSTYGYPLSGEPSFRARARAAVEYRTPMPLRRLAVTLARRLAVFKDNLDHHSGLGELNDIFGREAREIGRYVALNKVWSKRLLNRALTAELLLTDRF